MPHDHKACAHVHAYEWCAWLDSNKPQKPNKTAPAGTSGEKSGALHPDSDHDAPISTPLSLPPDVLDLARRLAALPESIRAALLAALKAGDRK